MALAHSAGYSSIGPVTDYFRPDVISSKVKVALACEGITPRLARSNFLSMDEVMTTKSVSYLYVPRILAHFQNCGTPVQGCTYSNQETTRDTLRLQQATVQVCNHKIGDMKLSRLDSALMTKGNQNQIENLIQQQVKQEILDITDSYSLHIPIAQAADFNKGRNAGKLSRSYNLGDTSPGGAIKYLAKGDARKLVQRMVLTMGETGRMCDGPDADIELYATPGFIAALNEDYTTAGTQCCPTDPSLTGRMVLPYGLKVNKTMYAPCTVEEGTGKKLEYVVLVSKNDWAAPYKMHYMDFENILHDMHMPYAYSFDSWLFDREGAVVATIEPAIV